MSAEMSAEVSAEVSAEPLEREAATRDVAREAARVRRASARARDLGVLLAQRPDLDGVYLPADVATEAVRWSV